MKNKYSKQYWAQLKKKKLYHLYTRTSLNHLVTTVIYFQLAYYDEDDEPDDDEATWDTESSDSWETIVEEVAYG